MQTRNKKVMSFAIGTGLFVAFVALGFFGTSLVQPPVAYGGTVQPFVVHQVDEMFGKEKDHLLISYKTTFARKSNASWSHVYDTQADDHVVRSVMEFVDVSNLVAVHTEPVTGSVMTTKLSLATFSEHVGAGFEHCTGAELAPGAAHQKILGFDAIRVSEKDKYSSVVAWVAPALDCYPLRTVDTAADGRRHSTIVTKISLEEPANELFVVPSNYAERSPSEVQMLCSSRTRGAKLFPDKFADVVQRRYEEGQKPSK